jgi:hypothetical protein
MVIPSGTWILLMLAHALNNEREGQYMKLKLLFTAEICEDVGDVPEDALRTEEENKAILESELKEMAGNSAEIIIHNFEVTKLH